MSTGGFRAAGLGEAGALRDLERAANLVALAHVFDPAEHPYPSRGVLERWRATLRDPSVTVLVHESEGLDCLVAHDDVVVRHLAVRPDRWRQGLATAAMRQVVATSSARALWCLEANTAALGLYGMLGWEASGRRRPVEWPPYPAELELVLGRR